MRIVSINNLEECLDGVTIREYTLSRPHERRFMEHLGTDGRLEVFDFARTFFRVTRPGAYLLKGMEGSETLNVVYSKFRQSHEDALLSHIQAYNTEPRDGERS